MDSTRRQKTLLDRLSALPDSVLTHIISFLPTKHAATTSILSRPWRNIWITIPDLDFDDSCLDGHCTCCSSNWERSFVQSVNRPFLLRENPIRRFGFRCLHECNSPRIFSWTCLALFLEPSEVNVEVRAETLSPVPPALFAGDNFVKIELSGSILVDVKEIPVSLPNVKNLRLDNVRYSCTGTIEKIVSGCPVLEDLDIGRSEADEDLVLNISGPCLKSLTVSFEGCDYHLKDDLGVEDLEYVLVIKAPNIQKLHLNDKVTNKYLVNGGLWRFLCEAVVNVKDNAHVSAIVKALANAKLLCFSGDTLGSIAYDEEEYDMLAFHNLSRLELGIGDACLDMVNEFLNQSPNLEILIFRQEVESEFRDPYWRSPNQVPRCLRLKIKMIIFEDLWGNNYELRLVRYLMLNARVVDHILVRSPRIRTYETRLRNLHWRGTLHLMP